MTAANSKSSYLPLYPDGSTQPPFLRRRSVLSRSVLQIYTINPLMFVVYNVPFKNIAGYMATILFEESVKLALTVNFLNIRTPKTFVVITLKF